MLPITALQKQLLSPAKPNHRILHLSMIICTTPHQPITYIRLLCRLPQTGAHPLSLSCPSREPPCYDCCRQPWPQKLQRQFTTSYTNNLPTFPNHKPVCPGVPMPLPTPSLWKKRACTLTAHNPQTLLSNSPVCLKSPPTNPAPKTNSNSNVFTRLPIEPHNHPHPFSELPFPFMPQAQTHSTTSHAKYHTPPPPAPSSAKHPQHLCLTHLLPAQHIHPPWLTTFAQSLLLPSQTLNYCIV
jgi:hypothetical protein